MDELIGWGSAGILVPAFATQTYRQWCDRHKPVRRTALVFFILVLVGTGGQVVCSWLVGNWVYFALNAILVVNNAIGLGIAIYQSRQPDPNQPRPGE